MTFTGRGYRVFCDTVRTGVRERKNVPQPPSAVCPLSSPDETRRGWQHSEWGTVTQDPLRPERQGGASWTTPHCPTRLPFARPRPLPASGGQLGPWGWRSRAGPLGQAQGLARGSESRGQPLRGGHASYLWISAFASYLEGGPETGPSGSQARWASSRRSPAVRTGTANQRTWGERRWTSPTPSDRAPAVGTCPVASRSTQGGLAGVPAPGSSWAPRPWRDTPSSHGARDPKL